MLAKNIINITILLLIIPNISHAYIDPVSISYLFTILISGVISIVLQIKVVYAYIKRLLIKLHIIKDNNKEEDEVEQEYEISDKKISNN